MAKGHGSRRDEDIRKLLLEQEASGLSVAAFARERGVPSWTLYGRRRRLRKHKASAKDADFVQVHIRPVQPVPSAIEVDLKTGMRVRVPTGFDADELRRLLGVLASC